MLPPGRRGAAAPVSAPPPPRPCPQPPLGPGLAGTSQGPTHSQPTAKRQHFGSSGGATRATRATRSAAAVGSRQPAGATAGCGAMQCYAVRCRAMPCDAALCGAGLCGAARCGSALAPFPRRRPWGRGGAPCPAPAPSPPPPPARSALSSLLAPRQLRPGGLPGGPAGRRDGRAPRGRGREGAAGRGRGR